MFLGEYQHTIDTKGRVIMPAKFRDGLGQRFIITKGIDKCLFVYTEADWNILNDKIKQLPMMDDGVRRFVRFFFGGACDCEFDAQGRIIIPQNLREHASIQKDIVSVGVSNRIEIWCKENWDKYNDDSNFIDNVLAEKMSQLGI